MGPQGAKLAVGLAAFGAWGWVCAHSGWSVLPTTSIEDKIRAAVAAAQKAGADWAQVEVDGQAVTLSGAAPSQGERRALIESVRMAAGPGGVVFGGVTVVRATDLSHARRPSPYVFSAAADDGSVRLKGHAPTERARQDLRDLAERLFPNGVSGDVAVAADAPGGEAWSLRAEQALRQLARLDTGAASLKETAIEVKGAAPTDTVADEIRAALEDVAAPFSVSTALTLSGTEALAKALKPSLKSARAETKTAAAASQQAEPAAAEDASAATQCAEDFAARAADVEIAFVGGAAVVDRSAAATLDDLAAAARGCAGLRVEVLGYVLKADETPDRILSIARAQAVADHLIINGVDVGRVSARALHPDEAGADQPPIAVRIGS